MNNLNNNFITCINDIGHALKIDSDCEFEVEPALITKMFKKDNRKAR